MTISDMTTSSDTHETLKAIITLAHSLQLKAAAKGLETEEQLRMLIEQGCYEREVFCTIRQFPQPIRCGFD